MNTPPNLPQGEECLTEVSWNRWRRSFFLSKRMPQSRDRRPRLSAFPFLHGFPSGNIPFFEGGKKTSIACVLADRRGRLSLL
ncbi:hypothetical protein HMPREF0973_00068 [Prevotella veroralis F0319]|uniref:Uncharacterized protein n=2 Tax=Prevotella veroralis TaxID=28137 RepID=C9MKE9_9BACT|nr:hypothetical protein HMPREF0973_00068 [Prevotella veroralis F0319]